MTPLLIRSSWRQARRHPWQTLLTILGVAVAVAVVAGIDLTHASSLKAFDLSVEGVSGKTTHEIVGGSEGFAKDHYVTLRSSGEPWARRLMPVLEGRGHLSKPGEAGQQEIAIRLMGIDPFAEQGARPFLKGLDLIEGSGVHGFLMNPRAVALGQPLAERLGLEAGDPVSLRLGRKAALGLSLEVHSILKPSDDLERQGLADLVICDLATAEELLARAGRVDRIDVVLQPGEEQALAGALPAGLTLQTKSSRSDALAEMTRAFRLNLHALSLLALLVGVFLVYNTLTFSVLQQKSVHGRLRALGVRRAEIFTMVMVEAAFLGIVGTLLGAFLGVFVADILLALVVRTINDLYFAVQVQEVSLSAVSIFKIFALGLAGPLLAACRPAWEACQASPSEVMRRSTDERRFAQAAGRRFLLGAALLIGAGLLLALPSREVGLAFAAVFIFVLGFSLWIPGLIAIGARIFGGIFAGIFSRLGSKSGTVLSQLAIRDLQSSLSRTGVAAAALALALATALGVGIMVHSFRGTLVSWLDSTLQADIYVSSQFQDARGRGPALTQEQISALTEDPSVALASTYRRVEVPSPRGSTQLHALDFKRRAFESFQFLTGDRDEIWSRFRSGEAVLISESYSRHQDLSVDDTLTLTTPQGNEDFAVAAIFYDYASDRGLVTIHRDRYRELWQDDSIQSLGLFLEPDADPDQALQRLRTKAAIASEWVSGQDGNEDIGGDLRLMSNRDLRAASMEIFDRTFAITAILRLLALGVAFFGLVSALMALQLEKEKMLAVMRALGATPRQIFRLVMAQTTLLGTLAGLASLPLGAVLSAMLIYVINKRSFGWTLHMSIDPRLLLETLALACVAAALAGLYPALRMSNTDAASSLREE